MAIIFDAHSTKLPKDVTEFLAGSPTHRARGFRAPDAVGDGAKNLDQPDVASLHVLDRWDVQAHIYKTEVAAKASFLLGLFSGSGKTVLAGIVHEAKRYRIEKTNDGRSIEIGVSVRLYVATTTIDAKFELSLPNIAAQAQLGISDARIGITVVGFTGAIGNLLPMPEKLDVENLSLYTNAAKAIQSHVFGQEGINFISPTILSFEEDKPKIK